MQTSPDGESIKPLLRDEDPSNMVTIYPIWDRLDGKNPD